MIASLERLLQKLGLGHRGRSDDQTTDQTTDQDEEQPPPATSESGAGLRHGQIPPGYVPPADEGRPPH